MNCFFCAKKISKSEITKRFRDAGVSQCSRWMYMYKCDNCNKCFDYRYLIQHNKLFKNTLIDISNVQTCTNCI